MRPRTCAREAGAGECATNNTRPVGTSAATGLIIITPGLPDARNLLVSAK